MYGGLGAVSPDEPYLVLAAYDSEFLRFNKLHLTGNGFRHYKMRDGLFWHESLHSYYFKNRKASSSGFFDSDRDYLVVGDQSDSKHDNFLYSWDSKDRGYIQPFDAHGATALYYILGYEGGYQGYCGDKVRNKTSKGHFVLRIDDKLGGDDIMTSWLSGNTGVLIKANIPDDFPTVYIRSPGGGFEPAIQIIPDPWVFIFDPHRLSGFWLKGSAEGWRLVNLQESTFIKSNQYGDARFREFNCELRPFGNYLSQKLFDFLKNKLLKHEFEMYVIFNVDYILDQVELDAEAFAVTKGGAEPLK
jgi:hypothetical protein